MGPLRYYRYPFELIQNSNSELKIQGSTNLAAGSLMGCDVTTSQVKSSRLETSTLHTPTTLSFGKHSTSDWIVHETHPAKSFWILEIERTRISISNMVSSIAFTAIILTVVASPATSFRLPSRCGSLRQPINVEGKFCYPSVLLLLCVLIELQLCLHCVCCIELPLLDSCNDWWNRCTLIMLMRRFCNGLVYSMRLMLLNITV